MNTNIDTDVYIYNFFFIYLYFCLYFSGDSDNARAHMVTCLRRKRDTSDTSERSKIYVVYETCLTLKCRGISADCKTYIRDTPRPYSEGGLNIGERSDHKLSDEYKSKMRPPQFTLRTATKHCGTSHVHMHAQTCVPF